MSKKHHANTPPPSSREKKGMGKGIKFLLIFLAVGGIFFLMNQMGIKATKTTEEITITNNPRSTKDWQTFKEEKKKAQLEENAREAKAEEWLHQFIDFKNQSKKITNDEKKFLDELNQKIERESPIEDAKSYFKFMNTTYGFYKKLKQLKGATPKSAAVSQPSEKDTNLDSIVDKMMDIQQKKLMDFSETNPNTEEWLEFIQGE